MMIRSCLIGLAGVLAAVASAQQQAAPAPAPKKVFHPLLPMKWTPKHYECLKTDKPIDIDGKLDEKEWAKADWTDDFIDIEGTDKPAPKFRTRIKLLWDDNYLYVAAELEEPDVEAKLTRHDSVIFRDNDFELFLKPLAAETGYFEFEINALNTGWDLFLNKPYRDGGKPDNSWDIEGLKTAVAVQGTLNNPGDKDTGWTVEIAIPWSSYRTRQPVPRPGNGTEWRANFSRVEWIAGHPREDNWVWSPQGVIDMHVPDRWGYLEFRDRK
jgi:Carbohydrate family 9 binding domain-like